MDINHQAPLVARKEIFVQAPPEAVWQLLSDINSWSQWQPGVATASLESPLTVGSVFHWKAGGVNITSTFQVVELNLKIGWTGKSIGMMARHLWVLRPQENGTLVTSEESMEGWLPRLIKVVKPKFLEESMDVSLKTLKDKAEGGDNKA